MSKPFPHEHGCSLSAIVALLKSEIGGKERKVLVLSSVTSRVLLWGAVGATSTATLGVEVDSPSGAQSKLEETDRLISA